MHYHALQGRGLNHIEPHVSNMTTDNSNNNNNFSFLMLKSKVKVGILMRYMLADT